jgi:hypothetical protein
MYAVSRYEIISCAREALPILEGGTRRPVIQTLKIIIEGTIDGVIVHPSEYWSAVAFSQVVAHRC